MVRAAVVVAPDKIVSMYEFLNVFFFVFHTALILFILLGWLWTKTRKINLAVVILTAFSWFFLGIWYGFGYCPSTDWHWQVRMRLGYYDMPSSYLTFLIRSLFGWKVDKTLVDVFAVVFLLLAIFVSVVTNYRDWKNRRDRSG
ncbi:MAG TPA: DUF2784 family protein [Candidatus Heimdallarchaeota archaeon]|nr:DUF2784 family protein [Candidatus Heimdallarchaeota archaeon]